MLDPQSKEEKRVGFFRKSPEPHDLLMGELADLGVNQLKSVGPLLEDPFSQILDIVP